MFERFYRRFYKKPFLVFNIIIPVIYAFCIIPLIIMMCLHNPPKLKETTGTIASYYHYVNDDHSFFDSLANTPSSYLDIRFADGSYFRAIGIRYENIDESLYSTIYVGSEITLLYEDGGFASNNWIYGIDYNGTSYLDTKKVLAELAKERRSTITGCSIAIGVLTLIAVGAFIWNFVKNKPKPVEKENNIGENNEPES